MAQQDAAVKYGGMLSRRAIESNPPIIPGSGWYGKSSGRGASGVGGDTAGASGATGATGATGGDDDGEFYCKKCNRYFKSHHALSVHFATSAAHTDEKDELKARGWIQKAENVGEGASNAPSASPAIAPNAAAAGSGPAATGSRQTLWNDVQRQYRGKGFTPEQIKDFYKKIQRQEQGE